MTAPTEIRKRAIALVEQLPAFRLYFEGSQGDGCVTLRSRTLQDQRSHFFEREFGCTAIFYPFND